MDPHAHCHMQSMIECYNLSRELDYDDLQNINIPETEGSQDVAALDVPTYPMNQPLNMRKVNIGTKDNPKFASVRDYWDEEMMENITNLLHEFQYLFPTKFSEMKGILGDGDPVETRCETSNAATVSPESMIQGACKR